MAGLQGVLHEEVYRVVICFIILYRFAEGFVIKIVPLFLKAPIADQGLGLTEQEIGLYYGTFGAAAFVLGSLLGGYYISAKGLRKVLFTLCCCFNIPFLVYRSWRVSSLIMVSLSLPPSYSSILAMDSVSWA